MTKPNQTQNDFQVLPQRVLYAFESELKEALSTLKNKLDNAIDGIKNSVNSALAESIRLNNSAANVNEPINPDPIMTTRIS